MVMQSTNVLRLYEYYIQSRKFNFDVKFFWILLLTIKGVHNSNNINKKKIPQILRSLKLEESSFMHRIVWQNPYEIGAPPLKIISASLSRIEWW